MQENLKCPQIFQFTYKRHLGRFPQFPSLVSVFAASKTGPAASAWCFCPVSLRGAGPCPLAGCAHSLCRGPINLNVCPRGNASMAQTLASEPVRGIIKVQIPGARSTHSDSLEAGPDPCFNQLFKRSLENSMNLQGRKV